MVCIPCIIIPAALYIWYRFLQPIFLAFWNPFGTVTDAKKTDGDKPDSIIDGGKPDSITDGGKSDSMTDGGKPDTKTDGTEDSKSASNGCPATGGGTQGKCPITAFSAKDTKVD